jgi:hypothetical protein
MRGEKSKWAWSLSLPRVTFPNAGARASFLSPTLLCVPGLRNYWNWIGHRLRLSQPGRVFFTVALLVGVAGIVVARAHGDREGGAPLVVLALLLVGVVTLDAVGRGVVAVVRRLI